MKENQKTILQEALDRGFSRRDFMKMCTALAATLGLSHAKTNEVVHAMETKERVPVIWLGAQDCTGCSESFIRSFQPSAQSVLLDMISLEYTEVLSAASGHAVEMAMENVIKNYNGKYIVVIEGAVPGEDDFLYVGGRSGRSVIEHACSGALAVFAYGTCACHGGIQAAHPNPTGAESIDGLKIDSSIPIVKVPGCPPIAEVMTGVIAHYITFGALPELDNLGRPKAFYRHRIHDKCNRRAYFDAGLFVENFDDEGAQQGYCLYKVGCKGPTTYSSCAEMRWNGGVSFPILSGNPCIGCTEKDFWDNGPFFERMAKIPGTQTTINPDKVGATIVGVAAAGVAVHATATAIKKKSEEKKK